MPNFGGGMGGGMGGGAIREEFANNPAQNERNKRQVNYQSGYGEPGSTFIDASVLMNVKADEYVAVFAITHQEKIASEADAKMNATVAAFKNALKKMGVKDTDIFVDFVLQNRVFTFNIDVKNERAKEELSGFEIKKNVSIHFKDKILLDKLASSAAQLGIYDLVKVDYVIKELAPVQAQLQAATARILKAKVEKYNQFGVKSLVASQVVADNPSIYYPLSSYKSYQAAQSNTIELKQVR